MDRDMTTHTYTPTPDQLALMLTGEVTEVFIEMEVQPKRVLAVYICGGNMSGFNFPDSPFSPGDELVVVEELITDSFGGVSKYEHNFPILTVTAEKRVGSWGWAITLERKDDE